MLKNNNIIFTTSMIIVNIRTALFEPCPERLQSLPRHIQEHWGGQLLLQSPGLLLPPNTRLNVSGTLEFSGTYFTVSLASADHEISGDGFLMISEKKLKLDLGCRPTRLFPLSGMSCWHLIPCGNHLGLRGCVLHLSILHLTLLPDLLTKV